MAGLFCGSVVIVNQGARSRPSQLIRGVRATMGRATMGPVLVAVALLTVGGVATGETLRYEAYAVGAKGERRLLDKGTREYSPAKDVKVVDVSAPGRPGHWSKRLPLFGEYELEADVYREAAVDGFGLVIYERGNPNSFSWNWFDREQGDVFVKRRGAGRLKVSVLAVGGLVELAAIEFLDDIALTYTDDVCCHEPGEHTHEFVVLKGSVLRVSGGAP
jgi:hypothetical protein